MEKKIKLSEKQKEVVVQMRNGNVLIRSQWFPYRCWMAIEKSPCYLSKRTIDALYNQEIIEPANPFNSYQLTDLGKTIEI